MSDVLLIKPSNIKPQQDLGRESFLGGRPKLPPGIKLPTCLNCGALQTFFFQVAFPEGQAWVGHSLAVFGCVACEDWENPVPAINSASLPSVFESRDRGDLMPNEDIPDGALDAYQRTGRFLVFPTGASVVRGDYSERVCYRSIRFQPFSDVGARPTSKSKLGGQPGWVNTPCPPGNYLGEPLEFLMQWKGDFEFNRVPGSPPSYNPLAELYPDLMENVGHYKLFQGLQLFFWGNRTRENNHIYMFAQND